MIELRGDVAESSHAQCECSTHFLCCIFFILVQAWLYLRIIKRHSLCLNVNVSAQLKLEINTKAHRDGDSRASLHSGGLHVQDPETSCG